MTPGPPVINRERVAALLRDPAASKARAQARAERRRKRGLGSVLAVALGSAQARDAALRQCLRDDGV